MSPCLSGSETSAMGARRSFGAGSRGEGWVVAQVLLLVANLAASFVGPRLPDVVRRPCRWLGLAAMLAGGALLPPSAAGLGRNLTPLPRPNADAVLVRTGPYRLVRHPIYSGASLAALGWAFFRGRWAALFAAALLLQFFDAKASHEELWLAERFPEYRSYRRAVCKLIPFVY